MLIFTFNYIIIYRYILSNIQYLVQYIILIKANKFYKKAIFIFKK